MSNTGNKQLLCPTGQSVSLGQELTQQELLVRGHLLSVLCLPSRHVCCRDSGITAKRQQILGPRNFGACSGPGNSSPSFRLGRTQHLHSIRDAETVGLRRPGQGLAHTSQARSSGQSPLHRTLAAAATMRSWPAVSHLNCKDLIRAAGHTSLPVYEKRKVLQMHCTKLLKR